MSMRVDFCPGCGELRLDKVALADSDGHFWGYDCHCYVCGWSGDISADKPNQDPELPRRS